MGQLNCLMAPRSETGEVNELSFPPILTKHKKVLEEVCARVCQGQPIIGLHRYGQGRRKIAHAAIEQELVSFRTGIRFGNDVGPDEIGVRVPRGEIMTPAIIRRNEIPGIQVPMRGKYFQTGPFNQAVTCSVPLRLAKSRTYARCTRKPFSDGTARELHSDVHPYFVIGIEIDDRRFHALDCAQVTFAQPVHDDIAVAGFRSIVNKAWKVRGFQGLPVHGCAVATLH